MKVFVAVLMFVSVSVVFAADVTWEVGWPQLPVPRSSPPDSVQTSQDDVPQRAQEQTKSQDTHESTGDRLVLYPQPNTEGRQTASQESQGNVYPYEQRPEWWEPSATFIVIVLSLVAIAVAIFYGRKATADAKQMIEESKTSRIKERAYVSVEEWNGEDIWDDEGPRQITFSFVNRGNVTANFIATSCGYLLRKEGESLPLSFDPTRGPFDTGMARTRLYIDKPLRRGISLPSGTAFRKDIANRRVTLYVFAYVIYHDGSQERTCCTFVEYNNQFGWQFIPFGGAEYNYDE